MKQSLRLDYDRLADAIRDKQIVEPEVLKHTLHQAEATGALFTDLLVREGLLSDWELSRVAAEVFGLAFLPVDLYEPDEALIETFETDFLRQHSLVPLDRYGDVITIAMPGMVPSEVLLEVEKRMSVQVLPVVGTVNGNQSWLEAHLPEAQMLRALADEVEADSWGELFDVGDAAVQAGDEEETDLTDGIEVLEDLPEDSPETSQGPDTSLDLDLDLDLS